MNAQRRKFDCQTCRFGRYCDDTNPAPYPVWIIREINLESNTCLLPMITPLSAAMIGLYWHYKNGLLAYGGGVLEQPKRYLDAMLVIDSAYARITKEQQDAH